MSDSVGDISAPPVRRFSETGIAKVLTSTRFGENPLALYTTGLPILQVALNAEAMSERLRALLHEYTGEPSSVRVTHANLVAYKQGNRGLIHYDAVGLPNGMSGAVMGKLYQDPAHASRVYQIVRSLSTEVFDGGGARRVPQALGCLPDLAMFVFLPVPGQFLSEVLPSERASEYLDWTAAWAAALHGSRVPLDRQLDLDRELVNVNAWATLVAHYFPPMAGTAAELAGRLRTLAEHVPAAVQVPIHKDFHYQHVFVNGGLSVIDFDEVRLGDLNFDIAHFSAHLFLLGCRTPAAAPGVFARLQEDFLASYARHARWEQDSRLPLFYAYTCLKLAKQLCTFRGVRPRPDGEEQARQLRLVLEEGLRALKALDEA